MGLAGTNDGNLEEAIFLIRIIKRSTDLITLKEIYRSHDINEDITQPGFSVEYDYSSTPATVTVTDESENPPPTTFHKSISAKHNSR